MTPRFKVGDQVLHLLVGKYTPVIIEEVTKSDGHRERKNGFIYGIRYLDGGSSFYWDEEEFFSVEEATALKLMGRMP